MNYATLWWLVANRIENMPHKARNNSPLTPLWLLDHVHLHQTFSLTSKPQNTFLKTAETAA